MKKSILVFFALLLLLAQPSGLPAADLYTGETVVEFGEMESAGAFRRALAAVLLKHTGDAALAGGDLLDAAGDPEALVLSYQYRELEIPYFEGEPESQRRLIAEFDPPSIDRVLVRTGVPRWGRERPELLVWLVLDEDQDAPRFLPPDADWLHFALTDGASRYGLELVFPLMDSLDMAAVRPGDVGTGNLSSAREAAERYGVDGALFVDLKQGPDRWRSQWYWSAHDYEDRAAGDGETPEQAMAQGLARLVEQLAAAFSVSGTPVSPRQRLIVGGLRNEAQYAEVLRYLRGLSMVDHVRVLAAQADQVEFELDVSAAGLEAALSFSRLLEESDPGSEYGVLEYRLR